jgi:hypothetical protein
VGAKFIIDRRCVVKSTLTLTGLIEAIKHRGVLRKINELAASGTLPAHELDTRLDTVLPPELGLPGGLTLRELQAQTQALADYRVTCRQCASSLTGHVGGCIVYVPYPISEGMEYLFWLTAVRGLQADLPEPVLPSVRAFAEQAMQLQRTPFTQEMRARGDVLGARVRVWQSGPVWQRSRLTSAQVLDAFFVNGMLTGDDLKRHETFLTTALAIAKAMEPAMSDGERLQALMEDIRPYSEALELIQAALEQGLGVYVWP